MVWIGFALLALLWGSEWVHTELIAVTLPEHLRLAVAYTLVAAFGGVEMVRGGKRTMHPGKYREWLLLAAVGVGLLSGPVLLLGWVRIPVTAVAVLSMLVPIFTVILAAEEGLKFSLLGAGLAGMAGAMLIVMWALPANARSVVGWLLVMALMATVAAASVLGWKLSSKCSVGEMALWAVGAAAVVMWVFVLTRREWPASFAGLGMEAAWIVLVEAPSVWLLMWLLGRLRPEIFAARYVWAPVISITEGWLMVRPPLTFRMVAGFLLMVMAGGMLVRQQRENEKRILPDLSQG